MIKINLLPEKYKRELKLDELRRLIVFVFSFLSFIFFILIILFVFSFLFLKVEKESILLGINSIKNTEKMKKVLSVENDVILLNKKIKFINDFNSDRIIVSETVELLSSFVPEGVFLKRVSFNREDSLISVTGFSVSRDYVLEFEKKLKNSDKIDKDSVYSPKSNILKDRDIDFSFKFNLLK